MNTVVTSLSPTAPVPGAASAMRGWLVRAGRAVWRALEEVGRLRARRELLEIADRCAALQPTLAKELRAAAGQGPTA